MTDTRFSMFMVLVAEGTHPVARETAAEFWKGISTEPFLFATGTLWEGADPKTLMETKIPTQAMRGYDVIAFYTGSEFRVLKNRFGPVDPESVSP